MIKVIPAKLLGSLGCYHYKLKAPLEYKIENTQGGVIVFIEGPIFEYGYGKTETEALDDLRASIIDLLNSLRTHSHELGKAPKQELRWLEKNIGILWEG